MKTAKEMSNTRKAVVFGAIAFACLPVVVLLSAVPFLR